MLVVISVYVYYQDIPACRMSLSEDTTDDKSTLYATFLKAVKKYGE